MDELAETIISQNRNEFLIYKRIFRKAAKSCQISFSEFHWFFPGLDSAMAKVGFSPIDWAPSKMLLCVSKTTINPNSMETIESIVDAGIKKTGEGT